MQPIFGGEGPLSSQHIRELIKGRILISELDETRIQPASFDPTLSDEIYSLSDSLGIFRPKAYSTVEEVLDKLPKTMCKKYSLKGGFELRKGFSYLIKLREEFNWIPDLFIKSSPKSSFGRLFLNTRMIADYNPSFDEVQPVEGKKLSLWLLVQPLAFNIILYPNMSINQLRFFYKSEGLLAPRDVKAELENFELVRPKQDISFWRGLTIHLDLTNKPYSALVAKHVWEPIDTRKINYYNIDDFFDKVLSTEGKMKLEPNSYVLFRSKEFLKIPRHLSSELRSHSYIGLNGTLHFAGFIDNGFEGQLVLEVHSDELSSVILEDNMPISRVDFYRCFEVPDKIYGRHIGSHYSNQRGVRVAKFFRI